MSTRRELGRVPNFESRLKQADDAARKGEKRWYEQVNFFLNPPASFFKPSSWSRKTKAVVAVFAAFIVLALIAFLISRYIKKNGVSWRAPVFALTKADLKKNCEDFEKVNTDADEAKKPDARKTLLVELSNVAEGMQNGKIYVNSIEFLKYICELATSAGSPQNKQGSLTTEAAALRDKMLGAIDVAELLALSKKAEAEPAPEPGGGNGAAEDDSEDDDGLADPAAPAAAGGSFGGTGTE